MKLCDMLLDADVSGGTSARWISAADGVLTLLDSTACCVKDALAGDVVVLFPAASDSPRSFSLHFVAGDALSFTWPANVSFRKSFDSASFEAGKGYALSFQEVGDGVFAVLPVGSSVKASDVLATEKVGGVDVQTTVQARLDDTASGVSSALSAAAANKDALAKKADAANVYSRSEIDAKGYLTEHQSLDAYLKTADLASNESDPVFAAWTSGTSVAVGQNATVSDGGFAFGVDASASESGYAFGGSAVVRFAGFAFGSSASASNGFAFGSSASASNGFAFGGGASASDGFAFGDGASASDGGFAFGEYAYADETIHMGTCVAPDGFYFNSFTEDKGASARSLQSYLDEKADATDLSKLSEIVSTLSAKVDEANTALEEVV